MTTKEVLIRARKLIEDPKNWKQGGLATIDQEGQKAVGPYCSLGAIGKTLEIFALGGGGPTGRTGTGSLGLIASREKNHGNVEALESYQEASKLLAECFEGEVHEYNDTHDHACVMAAFDAAIAKAK